MANRRRKVVSKNSRGSKVGALSATTKFKVVNKENPRYEGTRARKVYDGMLKAARGGTFTVEQLNAKKVGYNLIDARWDLEHGNVKKVG